MRYLSLGRSGLKIPQLVIGSTMFGELMEETAARAVLHRAWDLGANAIDTGDIYAAGRAEEMIGRLVTGRRDQLLLFTKVGFRVGDTPEDHARVAAGNVDIAERWSRGIAPHDQGLSRKHIVTAVEASLRRLGTDHIDLYQIHRWDPEVPIDETLRALDDLISGGKVRYIGCSNARGWQLIKALWTSDRSGLARFESMQVPYSLLNRGGESEQLPACADAGVSVIAYSSLAGGAFSPAHDDGVRDGTVMAQRPSYQAMLEGNRARLSRFADLAGQMGRDRISLALAGVLAHPAVTAATVGVQHPDELDALVEAVESPLESDDYAALIESLG